MDTRSERSQTYRQYLLTAAPLLLSQLNRDPYSPLYGSFDRAFWSWQSKDYSNADLQRGVFPLTVLYSFDFEGNEYYDQSGLFSWIESALKFWVKIQHKNGSFDQWYPRENSVGTTAFTLYPLTEAYLLLKDKISDDLKQGLVQGFRRAAHFIHNNQETHGFISNHRAGMAAALANASFIINDTKYGVAAKSIVGEIKRKQSEEGWFTEYGGADPGYESLGISYLAAYYNRTGDETAMRMIEKSVAFYVHFVHPDRTVGGEYGSRNTELYFPAGLEFVAPRIPQAESILEFINPSVKSAGIPSPLSVDLYNFIPLIDNYAHALHYCMIPVSGENSDSVLPCTGIINSMKFFTGAQLATISRERYYAVIGHSKGGVIKIYDKKDARLLYDNCGLYAEMENGRAVTSQMLDFKRKIDAAGNKHSISGNLHYMRQPSQSPAVFLIFRFITMTAGMAPLLNKLIKRLLSSLLIKTPGKSPVRYTRTITFDEEAITVCDTVDLSGTRIKLLESGEKFVSIFMGSSRYFQKNELTKIRPHTTRINVAVPCRNVTITDVVSFRGPKPAVERRID